MTENATARASGETSWTIPVTCALRGGPRGFAAVMVEQSGEEIVLDAQVTGGCMIVLDEAGATALFDILGTWLGGRDDLGVEVG
ncbi:MAG: hypothetical protein JO115_02265 [Pseudonocardiales bacterium]|nr:hypothetical protein [Pseudonocardiales bacterium]